MSRQSAAIFNKWISAQDRLPPDLENVLMSTTNDSTPIVGYFSEGELEWQDYKDGDPVDNVTHWMQLPLAPTSTTGS